MSNGSPESRQRYAAIVANLVAGITTTSPAPGARAASIDRLCALHLVYADTYYCKDGKPTSEVEGIRFALKYLIEGYANLAANKFTVGMLRETRQKMIDANLSRCTANKYTARIVRMFRWAASVEAIDASVWANLKTLDGLKTGRSRATETAPVEPIDAETTELKLSLRTH